MGTFRCGRGKLSNVDADDADEHGRSSVVPNIVAGEVGDSGETGEAGRHIGDAGEYVGVAGLYAPSPGGVGGLMLLMSKNSTLSCCRRFPSA